MNEKTIVDIKTSSFNSLVQTLELCNDYDFLIHSFLDTRLENKFKSDAKIMSQPARAVLELLRNNLVTIKEFYKCLKKNNLERCCQILENDFPNETNLIKNAMYQQKVSSNITEANENKQKIDEIVFSMENQENLYKSLSDVNSTQNQSIIHLQKLQNLDSNINQQQQPYVQVIQQLIKKEQQENSLTHKAQNILSAYEEILPVIYDNNTSKQQSPSRYEFTEEQTIMGRMFQTRSFEDRRLTFKKREFDDPMDMIRELRMIKCRHLNLYTAESIFKTSNKYKYYLLYPLELDQTKTLTEYASEINIQYKPNQFNTWNQLTILKDIASGLRFLHDKLEKKSILHGNLTPDNVMICINADQVAAKLFNFSASIEVDETDKGKDELFKTKMREEFYNFGLIIMNVVTWKPMDKIKCEEIQKRNTDKNRLALDLLWDHWDDNYKIRLQPNHDKAGVLIRMFLALTEPNYDISKTLQKSFDKIKELLDKLKSQRQPFSSNWSQ